MIIIFKVIENTVGLRVSENEEIVGLDLEEHGLTSSYADFMPVIEKDNLTTKHDGTRINGKIAASMEEAIPVVDHTISEGYSTDSHKLTKIVIVTSQIRFEALKLALDEIGITGMTVTKVLGYGIQKGNVELYRGAQVAVHLLPKVKVEIVVSKVPVREVIDTAKKVLYTGKYGDGKIFVFNVENVIKIRTGEEGYDALQDNEI